MKELIISESIQFLSNQDVEYFNPLCFKKHIKNLSDLEQWNNFLFVEDDRFVENVNYYALFFSKKYNPKIYKKYKEEFWIKIYFQQIWIILYLLKTYEFQLNKILLKDEKYFVKLNVGLDVHFKNENNLIENLDVNTQEYILTIVIKKLFTEKIKIKEFSNTKIFFHGIKNNLIKEKFYYKIINLFYRAEIGYGLNIIKKILLHIYFHFKAPIKKSQQRKAFKSSLCLKYEELIDNLLCSDFKEISKLINKYEIEKKFYKGKIRYVNNSIYTNTNKKILNFLAQEHGEILIGAQHGGYNYGIMDCLYIKREYEHLDFFLSWGWNTIKNRTVKNIYPLSSSLISNNFNDHKNKSNDIVYVTSSFEIEFLRGQNRLNSSQIKLNIKILLDVLNFLKNLNNEFNLYFRPYPNLSYSIDLKKIVKNNFPSLNIIEKHFHKKLLGCSLLILDHPGTTLNIAYASNIPTVLIWSKNTHEKFFNNDFREMFKQFEKNNLIFYDLKSFNNFFLKYQTANQIYNWWNDQKIQEIRLNFINKYASCNKNWFLEWIKFFNTLN